jgi:hypothetical protein
MKLIAAFSFLLLTILAPFTSQSQIEEDQLGAWYMYFFSGQMDEKAWGVQGDIQFRNWDFGGDLEQLLLRGGLTYMAPNTNIKLTLGYGNVSTGAFGSDNSTTQESRIYQEALIPDRIGRRLYTTHRFRYEQRFVENQDFRTRFRYNLFLNILLTGPEMVPKTFYLALYNEVFLNGERNIGDGRTVNIFDRNRTYAALGYAIKPNMKVQLGAMRQITNSWIKTQAQLSLHHKF